MIGREKSRPMHPIIGVIVLISIAIGCLTPAESDQVRPVQELNCGPVTWRAGMDEAGWRMLLEQGYADRPGDGVLALYPSGCEAS